MWALISWKKRVRLFVTKTSEIVCARLFTFITNLILHILSETNFGINYFWFFDISLTFKDFFNRPYWLQCVFFILLPSIFSSGIVCKWIYRKKSTWHKLSFSAFIFFFFSFFNYGFISHLLISLLLHQWIAMLEIYLLDPLVFQKLCHFLDINFHLFSSSAASVCSFSLVL